MPYNKISRIDAGAVLARANEDGPDGLLSRGEAAALIASRTMRPHDEVQVARNRVGMQMDRAARRGAQGFDLFEGGLARLFDGRVTVDELRRWATVKYGNKFDDLPMKSRSFRAKINEGLGFRVGGGAVTLPGTIEQLLALVHSMLDESLKPKRETPPGLVTRFGNE